MVRFRPDPSVRSVADGRVLFGGSPLRLWRFTGAGADLVRRAVDREDLETVTLAQGRVIDRLVDAGALHPVPASGAGPFTPRDVTVVVPVRDRPDGLERLLGSLTAAAPSDRPARIVVVDDGSRNELAHARVAADHDAIVVRRERPGGPAVARNDGIGRVTTPVVALIDSDCVVTEGWLDPLLGHFSDARVGAVAPRVRPAIGTDPGFLARYDGTRSPLDLGIVPARVASGTRVSYVPAAGLLLRREAFDAVHGFDPALRVGEDVDLVWRLAGAGWRVRYEPGSVVEHEVRPDGRSWLRQRFDYGTSAAALDDRHPGRVAPVSCSPWSAAGWSAVALGHPVTGAATLLGSAAALPRQLDGVPVGESLRLAVLGHLGAARLLARAVVRVWWPVALAASIVSRRARRVTAACTTIVVADALVSAHRVSTRPEVGLDPVRFAALTVADDVAYGTGVWAGCVRRRSFGALAPRLVGWPGRSSDPSVTGEVRSDRSLQGDDPDVPIGR